MKTKKLGLHLIFTIFALNCFAQVSPPDSAVINPIPKAVKSSTLGKNIIAVSPLQFLNNGNVEHDTHEGFGVSIERIFFKGYAGLLIPFNFKKGNSGYYIMPALKFYPTKQGVAKLSLGPQLIIAQLEDKVITFDKVPIGATPTFTSRNAVRSQLGCGVNFSFAATVCKCAYISFDGVAGKILKDNFIDEGYVEVRGARKMPLFVSFGINVGYRF